MKKRAVLVFIIFLISICGSAFAEDAVKKEVKTEVPKLAVKQLTGKGVDIDTVSTLTEILCTKLSESKKYNVLCAGDVIAILAASQQSALLGACDNEECFSQVGQILQSRYVLTGSIGKLDKKHVISLSITDVDKKSVSKRISFECSGDLVKGVKKAADKLLEK